MKRPAFFALVALVFLCSAARSAEVYLPPCYPGIFNGILIPIEKIGWLETPMINGDTGWVTYRCPPDNSFHLDTFKLGDILPFLGKASTGTMTKAEGDAARLAIVAAAPAQPTEADWKNLIRYVYVNHYGMMARVTNPIAFKRSVTKQGITWVRIGRIALNTDCEMGRKVGEHMRVDIDKVVMDSAVAAKPLEAFAICG